MKKINLDKEFIKKALVIAIPISMQSLIQSSLNMIDQFMIGQLGGKAIAGVGLGSRTLFIMTFMLFGLGSGVSIFGSQFWGKKDKKNLSQVIGISILAGILISSIFLGLSLFKSEAILKIFTSDIEVIRVGSIYQKITSISYIPLMIIIMYSSLLRSIEIIKIPMLTSFLAVGLNTFLNYILIFGNFGFPKMGVEGAAIATVITRFVEVIILLAIIYIKKLPGAFKFKEMFTISKKFAIKFGITTLPIILTEVIWSLGDTMFSFIYSHMGTNEIVAMTMTFPIQGLSIGFFTGVSSAAAIMIGKKLGAEDYKSAYSYAKKFIIFGFVGTNIMALILSVFINIYTSIYNVEYEVKSLVVKTLIVFLFVLWVKVSNMIIGSGILRSGGKTKYTLYIDFFGMWIIGVPLGLFSAFVLKLPIYYVYMLISFEEVVRLGICLYLTKSKKWIRNIVNEF